MAGKNNPRFKVPVTCGGGDGRDAVRNATWGFEDPGSVLFLQLDGG